MLTPRTVYVVACDRCGAVCRLPDHDNDGDYELQLPDEHLDPALGQAIEEQDWVIGCRHYCPTCAKDIGDALTERLAIEATHEPLFDLTDLPSSTDRDLDT
ncbi:hypothetical protein [Streptomyces chartreusis]|uniref:hypothetical protein n=1 Tax=Streptomyces chartreusis TaxID=1969 RepID=UPI0037F4C1F5